MLVKVKNGKLKRRIILNCKKTGISRSLRRSERPVLPWIAGALSDAMDPVKGPHRPGAELVFGVLDFEDAFWLITLPRRERRFFVTRLRGRCYVFLRTALGSRGAPLTWSRFGARVLRLTQGALVPCDAFISLLGDATTNSYNMAMVVYLWGALGLPIAFRNCRVWPVRHVDSWHV